MHPSVMDFLRANLFPGEIRGMRVLEVGSQDVNGSPRSVISPLGPLTYIGIDSGPGRGVDMVCSADEAPSRLGTFDVVVSTEMLEHARDWRSAVHALKALTAPGGILVVTTRSAGFPYHGFPDDHWRFSKADFEAIFSDFMILALEKDPMHPGIFLKAMKPSLFREADLDSIEVASAPPRP